MDDYVSSGTFWFTVAMVNAGFAEQKNRSRWNWFLLSVLLGPIATLLIVTRSPLEPADTFGKSRSGRTAGGRLDSFG